MFLKLKNIRSQSRGEDAYTGGNSRNGYIRKIRHPQPFPPRVSCYRV